MSFSNHKQKNITGYSRT